MTTYRLDQREILFLQALVIMEKVLYWCAAFCMGFTAVMIGINWDVDVLRILFLWGGTLVSGMLSIAAYRFKAEAVKILKHAAKRSESYGKDIK
jgi:hypothetical protein